MTDATERVSDDYPDRVVHEARCPRCGALPGFKCVGQHGLLIHKERAEWWKRGGRHD